MTGTAIRPNGIDVQALTETVHAVQDEPEQARFTFRARTHWQDGTYNIGQIGSFTHAGTDDRSRAASFVLHGDEPPVLLGENRGPNAVELLLQALAFCYAVGYAANAAARGIELTQMDYEVEGDIDLRKFLGLPGERPGFTRIRAIGHVASPNATPDELQELCQYVQDTSPVRDVLANGVAVETTIDVIEEARR